MMPSGTREAQVRLVSAASREAMALDFEDAIHAGGISA
jgi:hypothetical protein